MRLTPAALRIRGLLAVKGVGVGFHGEFGEAGKIDVRTKQVHQALQVLQEPAAWGCRRR